MRTVLLLLCSNLFMNLAWYWHLVMKNGRLSMAAFIAISWLIALPEYCLAVPANRFGHIAQGGQFTASQLKVIQEGLSLTGFVVINYVLFRDEPVRARDLAGLGLIIGGLLLALSGRQA